MFSFIILHYKNIDETINCLESLSNFKDSHFIVVDNASLTSDEESRISKQTKDIIKLEDNLGFAKANNKAIKYAYDKYKSDFYIVINNDVEINQIDFLDIINKDYKKYKFDMLGPWIDTPGNSVNPFNAYKTKKQVEEEIKKSENLVSICSSSIKYNLLMTGVKLKGLLKNKKKPENGKEFKEGVALHGCAIIFSKKYIEKYEYPFFNETFLFHEEDFLYQRVLKDKLVSIYDPSLKVFHKEGSTMTKVSQSARLKRKFREEERIKSLKLLLKEM